MYKWTHTHKNPLCCCHSHSKACKVKRKHTQALWKYLVFYGRCDLTSRQKVQCKHKALSRMTQAISDSSSFLCVLAVRPITSHYDEDDSLKPCVVTLELVSPSLSILCCILHTLQEGVATKHRQSVKLPDMTLQPVKPKSLKKTSFSFFFLFLQVMIYIRFLVNWKCLSFLFFFL